MEPQIPNNLSNLQLELLKIFSYQLSNNQLIEIKNILARYFAEKATNEIDKLWDINSWDNELMEKWLNEHNRTEYKK